MTIQSVFQARVKNGWTYKLNCFFFYVKQVIQPTPEISPCTSEAGLFALANVTSGRRAPLMSMSSVDPPDPDSRSLGSDSMYAVQECCCAASDTEDEVSGFSTDSDVPGPSTRRSSKANGKAPSASSGSKRLQQQFKSHDNSKRRRPPERWDRCAGCVPRRRPPASTSGTCMTISASVDKKAPR